MKTLLSTFLCTAVASSWAVGYSVNVTSVTGFPTGTERMAVVIACPPNLDCPKIERDVASSVAPYAHQYRMVPPLRVRQVLMDMQIEGINETNRAGVAEKLGVDCFLVLLIQHTAKDQSGAVMMPVFNTIWAIPNEVNTGSLEVQVVNAADGKLLMRGTAYGQSEWYSSSSMVSRLFRQVLEKGLGRPQSPTLGPPAPPDTVRLDVSCPSCQAKWSVQANIGKAVPLEPGALAFPADNRFVCPKCGAVTDLTELRSQLEKQAKKKIM